MIRFLLLWLFCVSYIFAHPQDPIDSLRNILKNNIPDTQRVKVLTQLSFRLSGNNPDLSLEYAKQALDLALKNNYERGTSKAYNNLGVIMRVKGDYPKSLSYFFQALQIDEKLLDDRETARTLSGIGAVYVKLHNYEQAIKFFEKALAIRQKIKDDAGIAVCCTNLGDIYQKKGNYELAIRYHKKSLEIERIINPIGVHYSLNSLGNIYYDLG
ncbi:MAG: tetratricopeptide repeat protein, partial [Raineya sp.]